MTRAAPDDSPRTADLAKLQLARLRALWPVIMGRARPAPPAQRSLLLRELAWRLQEREDPAGGLDADTQRLLQAAIRAASASPAARASSAPKVPTRRGMPRASTSQAARLVRRYRGVDHEVEVIDGGSAFRYRGRVYTSLTAIATEITGTAWSGPRFFGLTTRSRRGRS